MQNFKKELLKNKLVAVWGIGYLGYTTILRLNKRGFKALVFDFAKERLEGLKDGSYPQNIQKQSWSKEGKIPSLDMELVEICDNYKTLFKANVHIIAFPFNYFSDASKKLIKIFKEAKIPNGLVLFQSGENCCMVEKFISQTSCNCATAFRDDWNMEEFLQNHNFRVLSANNDRALNMAKTVFDIFEIEYKTTSSIKEAEIFFNAKNSLKLLKTSFLNELILSNKNRDISTVLELLGDSAGFNGLNYKNTNYLKNLLQISDDENRLSLIKEVESISLAFVLEFAEIVIQKNYKKVAIFGLSSAENLKDIKITPSIVLAEYLHKSGIEILINDPNFKDSEIKELLPFAKIIDLEDAILVDALFVLKDYKEYRALNLDKLKELKITEIKTIIDGVGIFRDFELLNCYHFGKRIV